MNGAIHVGERLETTPRSLTIGVIGAGKLAMAVAPHLLAAGHDVLISSSRPPQDFALVMEVMLPEARGVTTSDLIEQADIILLALPISKLHKLPLDSLDGKIVIDATNHWLEADGHFPELQEFPGTSSHYVQSLMPGARVIKAFNHMGYHDLEQLARAKGTHDRLAIAIAGDDMNAVDIVSGIVDSSGFDPVFIGGLGDSRVLQSGQAGFDLAVTERELRNRLGLVSELSA